MMNRMSIHSILTRWHNDPDFSESVIEWRVLPSRAADLLPLPTNLHPALVGALHTSGIQTLFSHQATTFQHVSQGHSLVITSGTASGKSLCYLLPVLNSLLYDTQGRALFLFPTKALTQDQHTRLQNFIAAMPAGSPALATAIYDGDTAQHHRSQIRDRARLLFSNPDMLHLGILPYHTRWDEFFHNLRFVIIDEMHTYRGVFGSHVANLLRRLKRVARFYGAEPQFILTSATIANPLELGQRLTDTPITLINQDGSGRGERNFLLYNPPLVDPALGLRRGVLQESLRLADDLLSHNVQTILFSRSRKSVEMMLKTLQDSPRISDRKRIRGYRSGYLANERREIEQGLRNKEIRMVITTNALELGIDIGSMEASLLAGYPGTIASTWQQAGRAGRGETSSLAVLLLSASPLDQFLARHPEYFFGLSPEQALINPDHLLILLNHLQCAAYELPFREEEQFGSLPVNQLHEILDYLIQEGILHHNNSKYYWKGLNYPAEGISLRSTTQERIMLESRQGVVGEVDKASAPWMVHPGAIYLHEGQTYLVEDLDMENNHAFLTPCQEEYFTEPTLETEVKLAQIHQQAPATGCTISFGDLTITNRVIGFKRIHWQTRVLLSQATLELPPASMLTTGYWLSLAAETVERLRADGLWNNDPNEYGAGWDKLRNVVRARDNYRCQVCAAAESERAHHVHHKIPFRSFSSPSEANRLENLITLCPACHRRVETAVRVRSGLAGLAFALSQLCPLFLMCDANDLGVHSDAQSPLADGAPIVVIYDRIPAGIGFSQRLFEIHDNLIQHTYNLVSNCPCTDGCPSCVGPGGENGTGGKRETLAILSALTGINVAQSPTGGKFC